MRIPVSANDNERDGPRYPRIGFTLFPETQEMIEDLKKRYGVTTNTDALKRVLEETRRTGKSITDLTRTPPKGGD